jgi:hypothetical protein
LEAKKSLEIKRVENPFYLSFIFLSKLITLIYTHSFFSFSSLNIEYRITLKT